MNEGIMIESVYIYKSKYTHPDWSVSLGLSNRRLKHKTDIFLPWTHPISKLKPTKANEIREIYVTWSATQADKVDSAGVAAMLRATVVSSSLHSWVSRIPRRFAIPKATKANSPPWSRWLLRGRRDG